MNSGVRMYKGFTLIELLVVIAIIAILAAILFPVFAKVREKARQISCTSNMKQLGLAMDQYMEDYDETFPGAWKNTKQGPRQEWEEAIYPYVKSKAVYDCPDRTSHVTNDSTTNCTTNPDTCTTTTDYGYNDLIIPADIGVPSGGDDSTGAPDALLTEPSNTILLAEADGADRWAGQYLHGELNGRQGHVLWADLEWKSSDTPGC
jgi:prepilin-type N-terminal cleavage/methylation domain-containing protein